MKSLLSRKHLIASSTYQLQVLEEYLQKNKMSSFSETLSRVGYSELKPSSLEIFQLNLGKLCNQTCRHCHVDAGPDREEIASLKVIEKSLEIIQKEKISKLDITGGAPEMNPHFRYLVEKASQISGLEIMVRCNLTILESGKKFSDLPEFFANHKLHIISSLPFYQKKKTDAQRGEGVFQKSISALQRLNAVGYSQNPELILDLVYNPSGAFLATSQIELERLFKQNLEKDFGINFNSLYVLNNMPINRFLEYLLETENLEGYMEKLIQAFNPLTIEGLMCKNTLSVDWRGDIYDCDFNQMLDLKVQSEFPSIFNFSTEVLNRRTIITNAHCFGCTAGSGSSCGGSLV